MIIDISPSPRHNKKYRALFDNGRMIDFGYETSETYLNHKDKAKREAYMARHLANPTEKKLIYHLAPSPALLSYALLWSGFNPEITTLEGNAKLLNGLWNKQHRLRVERVLQSA